MSDEPFSEIGPYERWPGYQRVKRRLEVFLSLLGLGERGFAYLDLVPTRQALWTPRRLIIKDPQLTAPANKAEFDKSGGLIRLAFSPDGAEASQYLATVIERDFEWYGLFRAALSAHAGASNRLLCIYEAMVLNEDRPELRLQSLSNGRYELRLDAHGNLLDSLLISEDLSDEIPPEE
jgi:hypothetical protein